MKIEKKDGRYRITIQEEKLISIYELSKTSYEVSFNVLENGKEKGISMYSEDFNALEFYSRYRLLYFLREQKELIEELKSETPLFERKFYKTGHFTYRGMDLSYGHRSGLWRIGDEIRFTFYILMQEKEKMNFDMFTCFVKDGEYHLKADTKKSFGKTNYILTPDISEQEFLSKVEKNETFVKELEEAIRFEKELKSIEKKELEVEKIIRKKRGRIEEFYVDEYVLKDCSLTIEVEYTDQLILNYRIKNNDDFYNLEEFSKELLRKVKVYFLKHSKNRIRYLFKEREGEVI